MARRLLGTGITNSNGVATLDTAPDGTTALTHSYTGVGAGKIDVVAESGSLQSEPYVLTDCLIFDDCTSEVSGRWYNYNNVLTVSYASGGVTVTKPSDDGTSARYLYYNDPTISTTKIGGYNTLTTPMCIEFDCSSITGSVQLVFVDNATPTANQRFIDMTATGHYKIILDGSTVKVYLDGTEITTTSLALTGSNTQFRLGFNAPDESITFNNLAIYPI